MTRGELLKYVLSLDTDVQRFFFDADGIVSQSRDTLSEEFQIAASIVDVFVKRAKETYLERKVEKVERQ